MKIEMNLLRAGYKATLQSMDALQPVILLLFRIYWGWLFLETGWGKLNNHDRVVEFFASLGIPAPGVNAWFVGGLECVGGLLLLAGLFSRPTAFLLTGNMLVAYLSVTEDRAALLGVLSDPQPFIAADPFFFLLTSALVLAFGPGVFSADALLERRLPAQRNAAQPLQRTFCKA